MYAPTRLCVTCYSINRVRGRLGQTHTPPFKPRNREDIERAILDVFIAMDREIARPDRDPSINIYKVQELLFGFFGQRNDGNSTG